MTPLRTLAIQAHHYALAHRHLFPGDGREAAAILLCASCHGPRRRLLVREVLPVPHQECVRESDSLVWPGRWINTAIEQAESAGLTIILMHSHPGGLFDFSPADDRSDKSAVRSILEAFGEEHGSAVMTPDGAIIARTYTQDMKRTPIDLVTIAGDDIQYWWNPRWVGYGDRSRPMAFDAGMTKELGRLTAVVIGASGTGSITSEQAARLGFGRIINIDFDRVELKNLNRILNSTLNDARDARLKVHVQADAVAAYRDSCEFTPVPLSIASREAILQAAQGDIIFGCVDSLEGRLIADLLAASFLMPLIDVGVVIPARPTPTGRHVISDVLGRIDYIYPGGSTLGDRGVYTAAGLRAEELRLTNPDAFREELAAGYIKGVPAQAPSVISLNMRAASASINEFIARAYPFRYASNRLYARTIFSLAECDEIHSSEDDFKIGDNGLLARGAAEPLLGIPSLGPT